MTLRCKHDREICEECASPALRADAALAYKDTHPGTTDKELAEQFNISIPTIERKRALSQKPPMAGNVTAERASLQKPSPDGKCNNYDEPKPTLADEESWESQPEIQAVKVAIYALSAAQREYVWKHLIPDLKTFLRSM